MNYLIAGGESSRSPRQKPNHDFRCPPTEAFSFRPLMYFRSGVDTRLGDFLTQRFRQAFHHFKSDQHFVCSDNAIVHPAFQVKTIGRVAAANGAAQSMNVTWAEPEQGMFLADQGIFRREEGNVYLEPVPRERLPAEH